MIDKAGHGEPFDTVHPELVVRQAHHDRKHTVRPEPVEGQTAEVLRTGLSNRMLSASGCFAQRIHAQTLRREPKPQGSLFNSTLRGRF